ncbi:hypothetical protein niasHT_034662 [Heterodera trifolii]|uniref:Acyl-coenzyme A thioesterase 13 n=1 Tax=Heterodera trifolii TaxID=157864 RepID=A0ABD2J5L1_9BILA
MCSSPNYLRLANVLFRNYGAMKNFERCAEKCRVVHAEKGRLKVEMELGEEHANLHGTLHGGMTATLVDIVTSTAICLTKRQTDGISIDLSVSFLAPAKIAIKFVCLSGDSILVDGFVSRLGSSLCFTGADIYRKSDGTKIATALHTCAYAKRDVKTWANLDEK